MNSTKTEIESAENLFSPFRDIVQKRKILLVDDEQVVRQSLSLYLSHIGFEVVEAENGLDAKELLEEDLYFIVFTDITMPLMNGLDLLNHINTLNREIDVVMITGHMNIDYAINAIQNGAFDYLKKPFLFENVQSTLLRVLEKQSLKRKTIELELLKERNRTESKNLTEFMIMLANVIDAKSPFTRVHSEKVSELSTLIGKEIGLSGDELDEIALGAKLHDIGKLGTPEFILHKAGPLTKEEYKIIMEHPGKGAEMVKPISQLQRILDVVHFHHEALDGSGYPLGLKGDEISLHARIVKIADYFEAITSKRPYRNPMTHEEAFEILFKEARSNKVEMEFVKALMSQLALVPQA